MAEPGNWFTIPSMSEKHLTEKEILGKTTTSQNVTLRLEFSVAPAAINHLVYLYVKYQLEMS